MTCARPFRPVRPVRRPPAPRGGEAPVAALVRFWRPLGVAAPAVRTADLADGPPGLAGAGAARPGPGYAPDRAGRAPARRGGRPHLPHAATLRGTGSWHLLVARPRARAGRARADPAPGSATSATPRCATAPGSARASRRGGRPARAEPCGRGASGRGTTATRRPGCARRWDLDGLGRGVRALARRRGSRPRRRRRR